MSSGQTGSLSGNSSERLDISFHHGKSETFCPPNFVFNCAFVPVEPCTPMSFPQPVRLDLTTQSRRTRIAGIENWGRHAKIQTGRKPMIASGRLTPRPLGSRQIPEQPSGFHNYGCRLSLMPNRSSFDARTPLEVVSSTRFGVVVTH